MIGAKAVLSFPSCCRRLVGRLCLAVRQKNLGSNPLRLSFLFKSCGLWTLSCYFVPRNKTWKWLSSLPILVVTCNDRYITSLFPTPPSLMVSVDVKQHVYLLSPIKICCEQPPPLFFVRILQQTTSCSQKSRKTTKQRSEQRPIEI